MDLEICAESINISFINIVNYTTQLIHSYKLKKNKYTMLYILLKKYFDLMFKKQDIQ